MNWTSLVCELSVSIEQRSLAFDTLFVVTTGLFWVR
jgi:hypothetical protein